LEKYIVRRQNRLLFIIAIAISVIGLIIFIFFISRLATNYEPFKGDVELDKSGQTGDLIGGIVGSIWSLAGVILYFTALRLQANEIRIQTRDFNINRITTILYNEVTRFESRIANTEMKCKPPVKCVLHV